MSLEHVIAPEKGKKRGEGSCQKDQKQPVRAPNLSNKTNNITIEF